MTVEYLNEIATNTTLSSLKLLLRWRGSIYKMILLEIMLIGCIFSVIQFIYKFMLTESGKRELEAYCCYCNDLCQVVPIGLVLGFFVSLISTRWWSQFRVIPRPDELAMRLCAAVEGEEAIVNESNAEECRSTMKYRRNQMQKIMRYMQLAYCMGFRSFSASVRRRFPTNQSILAEGLISAEELKMYEVSSPPGMSPNIMAFSSWAMDLVHDLEVQGHIRNHQAVESILQEIQKFRGCIGELSCYDYICIPLVYTQLATISVYAYILASLFALQCLEPNAITKYVPTTSFIQVAFYLCWLKVAEALINPLGEDDDDFELPRIMDRNVQVTEFILDKLFESVPPLSRGVLLDSKVSCASEFNFGQPKLRFSRKSTVLFMGSVALQDQE